MAALARPKAIAVACVVALAGLGWTYLALMVVGSTPAGSFWATLCRPVGVATGAVDFVLVFLMWGAMVLAMMLPTAGPMILTYAEIAETAGRKGEPIVSPVVLAAGYIAVWLGFALAAAVTQAGLAWAVLIAPTAESMCSPARSSSRPVSISSPR